MRARRERRRAGRRALQFQPIEPRLLLSADLVGSVQWDAPDAPLIPGDDADITVLVENRGSSATSRSARVDVYASADGTLDASDVLLGSEQTRTRIAAGGAQALSVDLDFTTALAPGEYSLLAVVDAGNRLVGAVTVDDVLDHSLPRDWRDRDAAAAVSANGEQTVGADG